MKKVTIRLIAFMMALSMLASYTVGTRAVAASKKASDVKNVKITNVSGKKVSIAKGAKLTLKAKVNVKSGSTVSKKVSFESSKKAVVSVNSKGVIKGKKIGTAKITITSKANNQKKVFIKVKVTNAVLVKKISFDETSLKLYTESDDDDDEITDEYDLDVTVAPSNAVNQELEWSTSNDDIADVDDEGSILAVSAGKATITAKATDGSGIKATCKVTVIDNSDVDDDADDDDDDDDDSDDD